MKRSTISLIVFAAFCAAALIAGVAVVAV